MLTVLFCAIHAMTRQQLKNSGKMLKKNCMGKNQIKNNKLNYEASLKQVDIMYPAELKESAKKSIENCKHISNKYKDICEASYWTAKCMYEDNPKDFVFA
ncbi:hypothetical protein evm_008382 [Chilo suppressalis]|nr:hypothetical protein evm_008382 [Chilo suppressalis]